ncbi:MAG: serine/threonine-protein kinase [Cyanobacteria bacterium J06597_16]
MQGNREQFAKMKEGRPIPTLPSRYQLKSTLSDRANRKTLLADDQQTHQLVVVKLMFFGPEATWEDLKLFEREAETLKSLAHPAIPKYIDYFEVKTPVGKGFALVQTYIEAPSLAALVASGHRFSERQLQPMARALLSILHYLHSCSPAVIHRDIKPSNILLSPGNSKTPAKLYLIDFGSVQAAKSEGTLTVVGTYGYMPPEQFGGRAQAASDLYSLGATLIYLATGQHPAALTQDDMQIAFENVNGFSNAFSPSFTHWLKQLTYADLQRRFHRAEEALAQLAFLSKKKRDRTLWAHSPNLTRADFHLQPTPNELVIQCLQFRIREPFRHKKSLAELLWPHEVSLPIFSLPILGAVVLGAAGAAVVIALLLYGWGVFAIAIVLFGLLFTPLFWTHAHYSQSEKITLTIHREFEQVFSITLATENTLGNTSQTSLHNSAETHPHINQAFLKAITPTLRPRMFDSDISFMSPLEANSKRPQKLPLVSGFGKRESYSQRCRLVGTHQEMQWLIHHIRQWQLATEPENL